MTKLETLQENLRAVLGAGLQLTEALGEVTLVVPAERLIAVCTTLRDHPDLRFQSCMDVCGVDYATYRNGIEPAPARFASVIHLLSLEHNWRLRVRTFAPEDAFPVLPSLIDVWPSVNWFERESFDLYGILYEGHPDLRRILTDYGFIGHPFRKDFPLTGNVEMRYDEDQKRVVYQPVTIEPREITPRVIREDSYGAGR
ncbi:NADH-quinone oxidoreductase subunit C [Achromobacter sp. GG226]|uniref:NADH-quinone oxidoreductase subunit C n=1 Tax=Verticiella alkaliphila TaxID=2779529 RepID=UPI001C0BDFF1|nr:NADH-quinone oxidoreductase subunit C [Verticiella sp. GG226]MBU4611234.1 NADH-quinone oxidoreductase subunit C [Verticiella sp. GG226]